LEESSKEEKKTNGFNNDDIMKLLET